MTTPSSISNPEFVDSEMWLKNSDTLWVEEGLAYGWEARLGAVAYYAFYAWYTPSGYDLAVIASLVPNSAVTDQYQVSSPAPDGTWNVWWDGNHYTTPATGMTSFTIPELGAEVATTNGCAQTFNMYSQAYNSAGQPGNWGAQTAYWVPVNIGGTQLNGFSYQNSEWSWNTVDTTGC
jgi:hypothetical protein